MKGLHSNPLTPHPPESAPGRGGWGKKGTVWSLLACGWGNLGSYGFPRVLKYILSEIWPTYGKVSLEYSRLKSLGLTEFREACGNSTHVRLNNPTWYRQQKKLTELLSYYRKYGFWGRIYAKRTERSGCRRGKILVLGVQFRQGLHYACRGMWAWEIWTSYTTGLALALDRRQNWKLTIIIASMLST